MLSSYKQNFINLSISNEVLKFGEFTLKSGRVSPYFFNLGNVSSGKTISKIGAYYAETITRSSFKPDALFGPAYKGIPLVVTTAISLSDKHEINLPYAFNRKEEKDHGERGRNNHLLHGFCGLYAASGCHRAHRSATRWASSRDRGRVSRSSQHGDGRR